mgnify:CR=1 FL=1
MWNVCDNDDYDDNNDDHDADYGQIVIREAHLSLRLGELKKTLCAGQIVRIWKCTFVYIKLRPHTHWSGSHKGESVKLYCFCKWTNVFKIKKIYACQKHN